jgi:hypothetical protein
LTGRGGGGLSVRAARVNRMRVDAAISH